MQQGVGWAVVAFLVFVIIAVFGMMVDGRRRARQEKQALADWRAGMVNRQARTTTRRTEAGR